MSHIQTLQDPFLNILRKKRIAVFIFLVNGIKLQGYIESFDSYVLMLRNTVGQEQIIYKHSISSIMPTRNIRVNVNVFLARFDDQNNFNNSYDAGAQDS